MKERKKVINRNDDDKLLFKLLKNPEAIDVGNSINVKKEKVRK